VRLDLNYRPRQWQYLCHSAMTRYTVLALHRRAGKTELAIMELVDKALKAVTHLPLFVYVAPFLKQAKAIAWRRLKDRVEPLRVQGLVEVREGDLSVVFKHNQAVLTLYGADNYEALRGNALDGIVLDEVAQMPPEIWADVVYPALQDRVGWALFIGTPKGVNLFSELFFGAATPGKRADGWSSRVYTVYDTGVFSDDQIESFKSNQPDTTFRREFLCDFSAAGDNQLISLAVVEEAAKRTINPGDLAYAPRILGVDPARFGDDSSAIIKRQGLLAFDLDTIHGIDNMALASRVAAIINTWQPDAVFVDVGNGSGVIDRLRQLNHKVTEVNFGSKAGAPEYANKRTEIAFATRDWLEAGGIIPNDVDLKRDLAAPTYSYDKQNRFLLESKDDIKGRGLPSPDRGDALNLTFSEPVAPKQQGAWGQRVGQPVGVYDPFKVTEGARSTTQGRYIPIR
jgi:hypothetical protein